MKLTFEAFNAAKVSWEVYEKLCSLGRAQSDEAQALWQFVKQFFDDYNIQVWTIGAIILGSKYYAKYLAGRYQLPSSKVNLRLLKKEVKRLGFASDLAQGIVAGRVNPDQFIDLV